MGWLAACGGGGEDTVSPPTDPVSGSFTDVDRAASAAFAAQGISGMGLTIYDANGVKRFERMYGSFSADQRVAIASSSKMVAGLVILRLIDQGFLTLDSTTGAVLGWTGPQSAITLRQLLSFTSGLEREMPCTLLAGIDARGLRDDDLAAAAGGGARHALRLRQHASARGRAHGGSGHGPVLGKPLRDAIEGAARSHLAGSRLVHRAAPGVGHDEPADRGWHSGHDE